MFESTELAIGGTERGVLDLHIVLERRGRQQFDPDVGSVKVDQGPLAGANLGGKATMSSDTW